MSDWESLFEATLSDIWNPEKIWKMKYDLFMTSCEKKHFILKLKSFSGRIDCAPWKIEEIRA